MNKYILQIILSSLSFFVANCNSNDKNKSAFSENFEITDRNYIAFFNPEKIKEKGIKEYVPPIYRLILTFDTLKYNKNNSTLLFVRVPKPGSPALPTIDSFYKVPVTPNDSANLYSSFFGYQLVGVFENNKFPIHYYTLFYVHPTSKNIMRVFHAGKIGQIDDFDFFLKDCINPLQGHWEEAKRFFYLAKRK